MDFTYSYCTLMLYQRINGYTLVTYVPFFVYFGIYSL